MPRKTRGSRAVRRLLTGLVAATGLAYPVCAAVCPRGVGGCPYPGRCFLFTDMDATAICDYTGRSFSGTAPSGTAAAAPQAATATAVPTTAPATAAPTVASTTAAPLPTTGTAAAGLVPLSALLGGLVVALATAFTAFVLLRSGRPGSKTPGAGSAAALAALFGLGAGAIAAYLLSGQAAWASLFATVYLLAGTVLTAYAWRHGAVARRLVLALSTLSALFGFAVLAPLMPVEFVGLVTVASGSGSLLTPGVMGVLAGIALALAVGRTFCGHLCPVGAVQELAYSLSVPKYVVRHPRYLEAVRAVVFIASAGAALSLVNLMMYTGVYDFFSLTASTGFVAFAGILALSAVVYRPLCRGLCPFGLLFSLPAHVSRFRLGRTAACVDCGRCERACPAGVAGRAGSKRECYLCGRCEEACRMKGALEYGP